MGPGELPRRLRWGVWAGQRHHLGQGVPNQVPQMCAVGGPAGLQPVCGQGSSQNFSAFVCLTWWIYTQDLLWRKGLLTKTQKANDCSSQIGLRTHSSDPPHVACERDSGPSRHA